jgi:CheY-like chemotaxis protein
MVGEPILILLVEDNPDHAELVLRTLAEHRIANKVQHLLDGQAALDYLLRQGAYTDPETSPRPHVILLDLRLPRVDGLEVLKTVKQSGELCVIPVIVLTTSEAEKDIVRAYSHYANSYLVKPVGYTEFAQMMESLGYYWLCWNKYPQA